jgi:signal transduction histidine kinase
MRDELKKARENERAADRSKKELVASLSHDIKTPVASIEAAVELMLVKAKDEKEKTQLERISKKAEQINSLVTDMFHATLEELQALSVNTAEIQSTLLPKLIQNSDYKAKTKPFIVPGCIVLADPVRLQQIFDNIIVNSYKYAGTDIEINAAIDENFLVIDIRDFGPGAPEDELPLLFNKFYRGKNAVEKSGYGLGLHIAKFLSEQMSAKLTCETRPGGFAVTLFLQLA